MANPIKLERRNPVNALLTWPQGLFLWLVVATVLVPCTSIAHFKLNLNIRIIHIEHKQDGLDVYLRLPMPYLVAALLGPEQADGSRVPAPFTLNAMVDGELMHTVDFPMLLQDAIPLGELAAAGHRVENNGSNLVPEVRQVRVYSGITQTPFSTLDEAVAAFAVPQVALDPSPYVGDSVVDVLLHYPWTGAIAKYSLSSNLDPGLPGQDETANLVLDYRDAEPSVYRITGLMKEPVVIDRSGWTAAKTFIVEGVRHILGGYDHVLFVVCLVLGALTLVSLAWRVTGFTLGHSVTLTLGFFGLTPSAGWFVPLIESGIALSIIYAAIVALNRQAIGSERQYTAFIITALIGMLHGLGFSFVLKEILGVTSSNIWISLLSFNVGVELGQLGIVLMLWPMLWGFAKLKPGWIDGLRWAIALPCIAVASIWAGQRAIAFLAALQVA